MQLTGKQIAEQAIILGFKGENIQQVGIDCRISKIKHLVGMGKIPYEGKTELPSYVEIKPEMSGDAPECWVLEPGYYEIELEEGCIIPNNVAVYLKQRSSLKRCGAEIESPVFDPGFKTDHMGTFMSVHSLIKIEKGARVCQAIAFQTAELVQNTYNGQFQQDCQRNG